MPPNPPPSTRIRVVFTALAPADWMSPRAGGFARKRAKPRESAGIESTSHAALRTALAGIRCGVALSRAVHGVGSELRDAVAASGVAARLPAPVHVDDADPDGRGDGADADRHRV